MDNKKPITLSGFVLDSQTTQPVADVPVALAEGANPSEAKEVQAIKTDKSGAWSFKVAPGDYVVRMPQANTELPEPGQEKGEWIFCGQFFPGLNSNKTDVKLEATYYPAVARTPQLDVLYISSLFASIRKEFELRAQSAQSFKEVEQATDSTMKLLDELIKPFLKNTENIEENVPCSTCQPRCYGSSDPYCLYKCMNLPTKCY